MLLLVLFVFIPRQPKEFGTSCLNDVSFIFNKSWTFAFLVTESHFLLKKFTEVTQFV
jgi:hypothetical protein